MKNVFWQVHNSCFSGRGVYRLLLRVVHETRAMITNGSRPASRSVTEAALGSSRDPASVPWDGCPREGRCLPVHSVARPAVPAPSAPAGKSETARGESVGGARLGAPPARSWAPGLVPGDATGVGGPPGPPLPESAGQLSTANYRSTSGSSQATCIEDPRLPWATGWGLAEGWGGRGRGDQWEKTGQR